MANELIIPIKYVFDKSDIQKAGNALGALTAQEIKLETEMNDVANAARKQATEFGKAGNAGVKAAKDTGQQYNMLGNSIGSITTLIAGAFALDRILAFGKAVVEVGAEFESLRLSIDFASGSTAEGAKNFQFLQEISARLGLDLMGAAQGFKQIVASSQQAGISNAETRRIFESVATASRAMGLSVQDSNGIFLALSQVISKGTVQAEELRGQIGERLPGAFNIAARAMGVTTQELNKMLEQGQVLSKDFLPAFATELQKTFEGALPAAVDSVRANMGRLSTSWDEALNSISGRTDGFLYNMLQFGIKFNKGLKIIFSDPVQDAKQEALARVSDWEFNIIEHLKKVSANVKKEGGNVDAAVRGNLINIRAGLIADLKNAQSALANIEKNIEESPLGLVPHTLKTALVETSGRVALLQGELSALKGISEKFRNETTEADKDQLGTIEEIRLKMKEITAERDGQANLSVKQATVYNLELAELQKQLDLLTKLQETKRSKAVKLSRIEEDAYKLSSKNKLEILKDEAAAEKDLRDLSTRNLLEELDKREAYQRRSISETIEFAIFAANSYAQYQSFNTEERIRSLEETSEREQTLAGDNAEAKKLIEKQYNQKIQAEREKQAKLDKAAALFTIAIDTAVGIQRAIREFPETFGLPFSAFVATQGAIQAALVSARPIPKYAKGTRSVTGGTPGQDSVLAMLMPGERVVTTDQNRKLSPAFDILTDSKRSPAFWNKTLMEIEKLGVFTPPKLHEITQSSSRGGIDTDRIVAAVKGIVIERTTFDERGVVRFTETESRRIQKLNKHYGF